MNDAHAGFRVQGVLEQAGRLVLDVVEPGRGRVDFAELINPTMQIAAAVANDGSWNAGLGRRRFQLLVDHVAVRFGHRLQVDQFYVFVAEHAVRGIPGRLANGHEDQAFSLAQLHRVVDDPHPVVGDRLGAVQSVQAHPHQPQSHRIITGGSHVAAGPVPVQGQHGRHALQSRARAEDQRQTARHHPQRKLLPGDADLQVIRPQRRQIAPWGVCRRERRGPALGFLWFPPRPFPLPPGDSRPDIGPWPSRNRGCASWRPIASSGSCSPSWPPCTWPPTDRDSRRRIEPTSPRDCDKAAIDRSP